MKPGEILTGDNGMKFEVGELVAVQGAHPDCRDPRCRRNMVTGECMGYHCPRCGASTNMYGHHDGCTPAAKQEQGTE